MEVDTRRQPVYRKIQAEGPKIAIPPKITPLPTVEAPLIQPLPAVTETGSIPAVKVSKELASFLNSMLFKIYSQDSGQSLTFINPHIDGFDYSASSGEEAFSRPFHAVKNAQSVEAMGETYSFPDLLLDTRYRYMGTQEGGGAPPDIEAIIEKLRGFMQPNMTRMRKHRLSILWGEKIIGEAPNSYLFMNSLSVKGDQYNEMGRYVTARLSMSFTLYGTVK